MERRAGGLCALVLNFSTFRGRHGIYLEDLFVRPAFRGRGIGKALLAPRAARVDEGWARFDWAVLDWNEPSIAFYKSLGAQAMDEWRICRLERGGAATLRGEGRAMKIVAVVAIGENRVIGNRRHCRGGSNPI